MHKLCMLWYVVLLNCGLSAMLCCTVNMWCEMTHGFKKAQEEIMPVQSSSTETAELNLAGP